MQKKHDQQSQELTPEFVTTEGVAKLNNAPLFAAGGPLGRPFGRYQDGARREELRLVVGRVVHSVSDMLEKKAKLNIGLLCVDGALEAFRNRNNCCHLRSFPTEERVPIGDQPIGRLGPYIADPVFADPRFAGNPGHPGHPADKSGFSSDRMMDGALKLDFDCFFTTNPELIKRGIGLQPAAFADFHFAKTARP